MDVAEELLDIEHTIDRAYVERRLDDWRARLDRLYADVGSWLPPRWTIADGGGLPIHEDLMLRFGVPQRILPTRTLFRNGEDVGRMEPRGLWIIGANGRVDILLPGSHYIVVDRTDSFDPPNWQIATIAARREQRKFTREVLQQILG